MLLATSGVADCAIAAAPKNKPRNALLTTRLSAVGESARINNLGFCLFMVSAL
jgi:hypothetical protein